jgi:hypothetical protein
VSIADDLVDRADGGARDSRLREARLHIGQIVRDDPRPHQLVGGGAIGEARRAGREPRVLDGLGRADRVTQTGERLIAGAGERDEAAVPRGIDIGRNHRRGLGARD